MRKGQLLAEIESDELRAALAEARARVVEAEAEVRLAEPNLARRRQLAEERILAAHDLDQATRDVETARARVETAKASVARYEALLAKSRIVAPIAGTVIAREGRRGPDGRDAATTRSRSPTSAACGSRARRTRPTPGPSRSARAVDDHGRRLPRPLWRGRVEEIPDSVTLRRIKPQDPSRPDRRARPRGQGGLRGADAAQARHHGGPADRCRRPLTGRRPKKNLRAASPPPST